MDDNTNKIFETCQEYLESEDFFNQNEEKKRNMITNVVTIARRNAQMTDFEAAQVIDALLKWGIK